MSNRFNVRLPPRYTEIDFKEVLDDLNAKYEIKVEDGAIKMKMFHKEFDIERFGKKFHVYIWSFCGHLSIEISEPDANDFLHK